MIHAAAERLLARSREPLERRAGGMHSHGTTGDEAEPLGVDPRALEGLRTLGNAE